MTDGRTGTRYRSWSYISVHEERPLPDAEARFEEATEGYEVLREPELRGLYDRYGHDGVKAGVRGGGGGFGGFSFGFDDLFGGG